MIYVVIQNKYTDEDYEILPFVVDNLLVEKEEKTYPFTAFHLQNALGWANFCTLTGIDPYAKNNGFEIKDSEIFYIKESDAKTYGLI